MKKWQQFVSLISVSLIALIIFNVWAYPIIDDLMDVNVPRLVTRPVMKAQAPAMQKQFTFTTATASDTIGIFGNGIGLHRIQWQLVNGTASACAATLQGSDDNTNWTTIISSITCTSSGGTAFVQSSYGFIRINVSSLTLGTARGVQFVWQGYYAQPANGPVDPTSSPLTILGSSPLFGSGTNITTGGPFSVATAPGILIALSVNTKAAEASSTFKCYDGLSSASGNPLLLNVDVDATSTTYIYNLRYATALSCYVVGTPDITLVYR